MMNSIFRPSSVVFEEVISQIQTQCSSSPSLVVQLQLMLIPASMFLLPKEMTTFTSSWSSSLWPRSFGGSPYGPDPLIHILSLTFIDQFVQFGSKLFAHSIIISWGFTGYLLGSHRQDPPRLPVL